MFINVGVDVGSESTKAVALKDGKIVLGFVKIGKGIDSQGASEALSSVLEKAGIAREDVNQIVATGTGRYLFKEADRDVSGVTCQARGVNFLLPSARTILEIGGEYTKAIRIDGNGNVREYFINEKCAMGTGRALDMMARILGVDIDLFDEYDARAQKPMELVHKCPVFAESEVIRLLARGAEKERIIAGLHMDAARRASGLIYRCGLEEKVVMTGGVALNGGVVRAVERELKRKVLVPPNPQSVCALGAALYGYEEMR